MNDQEMLAEIVNMCKGIGHERKDDTPVARVSAVLVELAKCRRLLLDATYREDMGR